jgi:hypothetical protein
MREASKTPPPENYPVIEPWPVCRQPGHVPRTIPSRLLNNEHCIEHHGYGLARIAERGGLSPQEIARNILGVGPLHPVTPAEAEAIIAKALA